MLDKFCFKKLIHLNYHQFVSNCLNNNLTLVKYNAMSSDVCCWGYIETIMENQLLRISCHYLFLI